MLSDLWWVLGLVLAACVYLVVKRDPRHVDTADELVEEERRRQQGNGD